LAVPDSNPRRDSCGSDADLLEHVELIRSDYFN